MTVPHTIKRLIRLGNYIYTPVALLFLFFVVVNNADLFLEISKSARADLLIFTVIVWLALNFFGPALPSIVLGMYGYHIGYKALLMIGIKRLPGKYIPGGVWHTVGRFSDYYYHYNVKKKHLSTLALFEIVTPIPVTLILGGASVFYAHQDHVTGYHLAIVVLMMLSAVFALVFVCFGRWRRGKINEIQVVGVVVIKIVLVTVLFWVLAGSAFAIFIESLAGTLVVTGSPITIAGTYVFSWGIGYLAVFAPQGIGVSEVVAAKLLQVSSGFETVILLLLGFRLVILVSDIIIYSVFFLTGRFLKQFPS